MWHRVTRRMPPRLTGRSQALAALAGLVLALFGLGVVSTTTFPANQLIRSAIDGLIGGGSPAESRGSTRDLTLPDLASFDEFPLYSVGSDFEGLSLTRVIRHVSPPTVPVPENIVLLIYGTCTIPENATGCRPPLTIRMERVCDAPRPGFASQAFDQPHLTVRGLDAARISGHLRLWTGSTAVTIYTAGADAEAMSLRAAEVLQPANAAAANEVARVAAPGDLPSQAKVC